MDSISAAERQPIKPEGGPKDNETYAEVVAERMISIRRMVVESTVVIGRAVVRRAVSIRTSLMKGWFKNILQVHKRND